MHLSRRWLNPLRSPRKPPAVRVVFFFPIYFAVYLPPLRQFVPSGPFSRPWAGYLESRRPLVVRVHPWVNIPERDEGLYCGDFHSSLCWRGALRTDSCPRLGTMALAVTPSAHRRKHQLTPSEQAGLPATVI